jgi:hypothetical protein
MKLPRHSRAGGNPVPKFLDGGYLLFQRAPKGYGDIPEILT